MRWPKIEHPKGLQKSRLRGKPLNANRSLRGQYDYLNQLLEINPLTGETERFSPTTTFTHEMGHRLDDLLGTADFLGRNPGATGWPLNPFLTKRVVGAMRSPLAAYQEKSAMLRLTESDAAAILADNPAMANLFDELLQAPSIVRLRANYASADKRTRLGKYLRYLLSPVELFARTTEQYVAMKSADEGVITILQEGTVPYFGLEEFAPIEKAMDELLAEKGLLK